MTKMYSKCCNAPIIRSGQRKPFWICTKCNASCDAPAETKLIEDEGELVPRSTEHLPSTGSGFLGEKT